MRKELYAVKDKIKSYLLHSKTGILFAPLLALVLLALCSLVNSLLLGGKGTFLFIFAPLCLLLPVVICSAIYKKDPFSSYRIVPEKNHVPFLVFALLALCFGALVMNFIFCGEEHLVLYGSFSSKGDGIIIGIIYFISFAVIAPVLEDLLFFGVVFKALSGRGPFPAICVSVLLFSFLDLDFSRLAARLFIGVLLCLVLRATRSIAACSALHVLYNIFALYLQPVLLAMKKVSGQTELFLFLISIMALISLAMFFNQASYVYSRRAVKEIDGKTPTVQKKHKDILYDTLALIACIPVAACAALFLLAAMIRLF